MRRFFGLLTLFGREDFKTYRGTLTPEEHDGRPGQHLTLVHIPETAGSSFLEDSPGFMKRGDVLVGNRGRSWWYTREIQQVAAEAMVVIVRSPVAQTVSQFLKCKYDTWGKRETRKSRFPRRTAGDVFGGLNVWLRHFTSRDGNDTISDNFRCYQPWNMQARYLGAESVTDHHYWYAESVSELRPSFARTKRALDESGFVGIADFYSATMCLFHHHNTGNYRSFTCSCAAALEKQKKSKAKKKKKRRPVHCITSSMRCRAITLACFHPRRSKWYARSRALMRSCLATAFAPSKGASRPHETPQASTFSVVTAESSIASFETTQVIAGPSHHRTMPRRRRGYHLKTPQIRRVPRERMCFLCLHRDRTPQWQFQLLSITSRMGASSAR